MSIQKISVKGAEITITQIGDQDFISLTDMTQGFEGGSALIEQWLRNKDTLEFLATWERIYNPSFNSLEFEGIKTEAGLNRFYMSVKQWIEKTNATGIQAKAGRYGGTFAHRDIAFEFGTWLSPEFKLYLIKEFQRLKEIEIQRESLGWNLNRTLSKINYHVHKDAVRANLIPPQLDPSRHSYVYATEADLLNLALFGHNAADWRAANPTLQGNVRDHSSAVQLLVLANLEMLNAYLIDKKVPREERLLQLNRTAIAQLKLLTANAADRKLDSGNKSKKNDKV